MSKEEAKDDGKRGVVTEIPITTKISDNGIDEVQQEVILEEPRSIAQESQGESQSHWSGTVGMMRLMKCILHSCRGESLTLSQSLISENSHHD
ncbi:hypothetical protein LWI29_014223 [Acer saccharum]|uniref:Uncharacterized protein n=1 Tax=Acer saccharum TaxID=4024 RepID=A0AA39W998_ACESA|nr:hypothetical protein LWI29_014223 [Acer saccharum]